MRQDGEGGGGRMKKDEVRCLRLKRDQLLELLWACYRGMGYKGLKLSR